VIYERILQNSTEYEADLKYFYLFVQSVKKVCKTWLRNVVLNDCLLMRNVLQ